MNSIKKIKNSNAYTCYNLSKSLIDNITTFLSLFSSINLLNNISNNNILIVESNNTLLNQTIFNQTNTNDYNGYNYNLQFTIMKIFCAFFGLVRIINDFINLFKYGKEIPDEASKGDYIGVFGEDLGILCIDTINKSYISSITIYDKISSIFSSFNFCYTALSVMGIIIIEGIKQTVRGNSDPNEAMCIIKFLGFVGLSGFYVLYRWASDYDSGDQYFDIYILYILYMLISALHTYIFITILKEN